ncbi:hypothetical protein PR048_017842 [Dryococelus australis]|uniref:PiggyBac transposable element-derived protein domain-containing protein n=1 Tax=Dryococelus australis TaxID=614101 RepID=A0ABQ9HAX9_9NEOP|nr:hypothetical protein PR048_017842 [Dryococelus australis]
MIDESTGDMCKPEVITFYNLTKEVVDVVDEMKASYVNSRISYKCDTNDQIDRRTYIKALSLDLMKPHLVIRASIPTLPGQLVCQFKHVSGLQVVDNQPPPTEGFCGICPRGKNRRTKKICARYTIPICNEYTMFTCVRCVEGDNSDND